MIKVIKIVIRIIYINIILKIVIRMLLNMYIIIVNRNNNNNYINEIKGEKVNSYRKYKDLNIYNINKLENS